MQNVKLIGGLIGAAVLVYAAMYLMGFFGSGTGGGDEKASQTENLVKFTALLEKFWQEQSSFAAKFNTEFGKGGEVEGLQKKAEELRVLGEELDDLAKEHRERIKTMVWTAGEIVELDRKIMATAEKYRALAANKSATSEEHEKLDSFFANDAEDLRKRTDEIAAFLETAKKGGSKEAAQHEE